jgi:hypothetical protein
MELPHQYPYNPRVHLILFVSGAGVLWIGVQRLSWGRMPSGFGLWFGLVPVLLGLILCVRRLAFERRLLFERGELILPTGFFQVRTARIAYNSIEGVSRVHLPWTAVLRIKTRNRRFEIVSVLLPDSKSYLAVEEFLNLKAQENATNKGASKSQSK